MRTIATLVRLRKRSEFWMHLTAYGLVTGMLIAIWLMAGYGFFWPVFPLLGWASASPSTLDAFRRPWSEERIGREMDRLG